MAASTCMCEVRKRVEGIPHDRVARRSAVQGLFRARLSRPPARHRLASRRGCGWGGCTSGRTLIPGSRRGVSLPDRITACQRRGIDWLSADTLIAVSDRRRRASPPGAPLRIRASTCSGSGR
jgi:hypothetical protein